MGGFIVELSVRGWGNVAGEARCASFSSWGPDGDGAGHYAPLFHDITTRDRERLNTLTAGVPYNDPAD